MGVVADLHLHSRHSRAVSSQMTLPLISQWASKKGLDLVGTGDFTHPMWFRELEAALIEIDDGVYKLRSSDSNIKFLLTTELSCVYSDKGKGRRIHIVIILPSIDLVKRFNAKLSERGVNLFSDGRPIMGLSFRQVVEIVLGVSKQAIIIPSHAWTPWYGFYGQMSGYDSLSEALGGLEKYIPAIETGLSSDPAMNWRIEELIDRQIVSFGDAHSPQKLGREATVFELTKLTFKNIKKAIEGNSKEKVIYTIEFYPEEGKYHYTGHRKCGVVYSSKETKKLGAVCPVCGKELTMGVTSRVESLAKVDIETASETDEWGVRWIKDKHKKRTPYIMLVPLLEIIAEVLGVGVATKGVMSVYETLINNLGSEYDILLKTKPEEIGRYSDNKLAEAIKKVRAGDIYIKPGFDGVFGEVKIWKGEKEREAVATTDQTTLF